MSSYLAGTLLLRGRTRMTWTALLLSALIVVGGPVQIALGETNNAVVAVVAFALAWMWGRVPGAAIGFLVAFGNFLWADAAGVAHAEFAPAVTDAVAIGATAFLAGHIGCHLERALGARARSDRALIDLEHVARDRMLTITDQVPVGLYRTTPQGQIVGGNDALMGILGFSSVEAMMRTNVWDHYVRPEDRRRHVDEARSAEGSWTEFELKTADGKTIWVRDWARGVENAAGEITHYDGVLEDVTAQHVADERFRAAFEDSPYGMVLANVDGSVVRGNQAIADLLGVDLANLPGANFVDFSFEDDIEPSQRDLAAAAAGDTVGRERRIKRPDGSHIWVSLSLTLIRDTTHPQLFIAHVTDITERRAASEALENLSRSKDELIASVSHELRTPLTVVHGLALELDNSWISFSVPEQKEFIGLIAQQSAEVAHIVEDLLVAARADIGKLPIDATSVDLREQLESALMAVPETDVSIEWVGEEAPVAFADATRVRQIIRNLLVNAKRYGGPNVQAWFGSDGEEIWLEIRDDGQGIPEDAIAEVFEPYSRAHNATGQPSSVGLGLTVSRKLAQLMGGTLEYRYESEWSCFRLELPAAGSVGTGSGPTPASFAGGE